MNLFKTKKKVPDTPETKQDISDLLKGEAPNTDLDIPSSPKEELPDTTLDIPGKSEIKEAKKKAAEDTKILTEAAAAIAGQRKTVDPQNDLAALSIDERHRIRLERRRKQVRRQRISLGILLAVLLGACIFMGLEVHKMETDGTGEMAETSTADESAETEAASEISTLHLLAVGDNCISQEVYDSVNTPKKTWNYRFLYANMREQISNADIAMVMQDSALTTSHKKVSDYPDSRVPAEVADALAGAGFDVIGQASDDVYDFGSGAVKRTLSYWNANYPDITVTGIFQIKQDLSQIKLVTANSISLAVLNYTTVKKGTKVKDGTVDVYDSDQAAKDISRADVISDMTVVMLHCGKSGSDTPTKKQLKILKELMADGADIVICSGSHRLQNMEMLESSDGHQMLVYYSLGDFLSSDMDIDSLLGGMADITITKDAQGNVELADYQLVPLVRHINYKQNLYTVYTLSQYTDALAGEHSIHTLTKDEFDLNMLNAGFAEIQKMSYQAEFS